jgi:DNA uptake protein ComE-like DNA-binding protein
MQREKWNMPSHNNLMDLNKTSRKLLTQLPGISKDLAYKVVNYRNQHGGFSEWSDVESVLRLPPAGFLRPKARACRPGKAGSLAMERKSG